ncbi:protein SEC13 [Histomonas meleagridis]|uniref:protein SEC13-like n=1 Tax=Histomonas meleagridis TaxID=135588 RepID=UPI00355A59FF|nr:protein SEC13 [Histomonas meleagridis]KAH0805701.1 protein SEC13-like [Histomonas meleagridis]
MNGTLLAFLYIDGSVKIYESDENRKFSLVAETSSCCHRATSISFSSSDYGAIFVVSDEVGKTYLYQRVKVGEFNQVMTFQQHKSPINAVAFQPFALCFASGASDGFVSFTSCDMKSWSIQTQKVSDKAVTSLSWSPPSNMSFIDDPNGQDTTKLVAASADGYFTVFAYNGTSWAPYLRPVAAHQGAVNGIAWRPLAGFSRFEIVTCGNDMSVKMWTYEDNVWSSYEICKCYEEPMAVRWSSCGFLLSVSYGANTTSVWREIANKQWKVIEE